MRPPVSLNSPLKFRWNLYLLLGRDIRLFAYHLAKISVSISLVETQLRCTRQLSFPNQICVLCGKYFVAIESAGNSVCTLQADLIGAGRAAERHRQRRTLHSILCPALRRRSLVLRRRLAVAFAVSVSVSDSLNFPSLFII